MSDTATQSQAIAASDIPGFVAAVIKWVKNNLKQAVFNASIAGAVGYVINVFLTLIVYNGYKKIGDGPATGEGTLLSGSLVWAIGSAVVFGLIGYWRAVGTARFLQDVGSIPTNIGSLFRQDGHGARIHLLWGATLGLLSIQLISPWLSAVFALSFFVLLPSLIGRIVSSFLLGVWSQLMRQFAPTKNIQLGGAMTMAVGLLGL